MQDRAQETCLGVVNSGVNEMLPSDIGSSQNSPSKVITITVIPMETTGPFSIDVQIRGKMTE
jgi:hypothetical protein